MNAEDWQAVRFMLISTAAFTVLNATAKYLSHFSAFEIVFFRAGGSFILCMGFLLWNQISIWGNQRKLLITRGLTGMCAMTTFFLAVQALPFGTAISLRYLSPIFGAMFAVLLLKEKVKPLQWLCFLIAFSGVVLLKGFDSQINLLGLVYILISAALSGLVYVLIQRIGKGDHPVVVINYFMFIAMCFGGSLAVLTDNWRTPVGVEWLIFASMGLFGFFGQLFMTMAFQKSSVTKVGPFKYMEVLFALSVSLFFFGESYTMITVIGISLVIGGMLLNVLVKRPLR